MGVNLYEHDGYLFSYPVLLKILHKERAVSIDRMRESRLRPSVLCQTAQGSAKQTSPV